MEASNLRNTVSSCIMSTQGFNLSSNSPKRIAFLIIAHSDVHHLRRLCHTLRPHRIFIHWDKKSGSLPDIPDVEFVEKREAVFWAGFSQIKATMNLIKAALATEENYLKIVLLSGADYPIKPISELAEKFSKDNGHNYIRCVKVNDAPNLMKLVARNVYRDGVLPLRIKRTKYVTQIERAFRLLLNKLIALTPRHHPKEELFHGSQWWALSPEACRYAVNVYEDRADLRKFYSLTFVSDEQYFHTIIMNSHFREKCEQPVPFKGRGTYRTANLHIIDPSLSKWFTASDIKFIETSDKFFVRKVQSGISDELINHIDTKLINSISAVDQK